ncbi:TPM domain-containing protein [Dokdonella ginsengisoli]|uniref:TPM domain-containing protein n=1 Tax=Dokdonella ginsengisoli TaxID=363846 RepID=A0ABV9QS38_9GAMM
MRALRHLFDLGSARRHFPPAVLDAIQHAIKASEHRHLGEIVFAVEGSLPPLDALRGVGARERAQEAFARLRVWNTEGNTGVLVYVLLADHAIEILADRGIAAKVAADEWHEVCALIQRHFTAGDYQRGAIAGVEAITAILVRHFPADGRSNPDELPDRPVLL